MSFVESPGRGKATPLPRMQMIVISVCLLSESMCATMLIPFVGLFVAFMQGWKAEEAGYASGFLIGLFMLGQVISCKAWSLLSDRHGRKIGIVLGISGSAVATLFFGLSTNIWVCSFWRFVHGLFTGSSLISKTVIADVTDKTNEAKGFMLISLTWGVGLLFGPAIGGFLYDPAHSSFGSSIGVSEDGFMSRYPAFLPSLFTAIYNVVATGVAVLFLEESNHQARPLVTAFPAAMRGKVGWLVDFIQPKIPEGANDVTIVDTRVSKNDQASGVTETSPTTAAPPPKFGFKQAFQLRLTRDVLVVSMLISASDMIYAETFPLWGIAEISAGGLGLKADSIGVLILVNSVPGIGANVIFPSVLKWYNDELKFFKQTEIAYAILSFLVAFAPYFGPSGGFWYAMLIGLIRKGWESWCWSVLMMVCAQTAPRGKVGVMYAVQQASACVVRCIIPFIGAPLFAWSIMGHHIFPFNHFLLFVLSAIPLVFSYFVTQNIFIPAEYELGEEPAPCTEENAPQQAPVGFSSRSFLGSHTDGESRDGDLDDDEAEGLANASFSTLATSFAMAMGPGNLQPSVMIGNITGEDTRQEEDEQDPVGAADDARER